MSNLKRLLTTILMGVTFNFSCNVSEIESKDIKVETRKNSFQKIHQRKRCEKKEAEDVEIEKNVERNIDKTRTSSYNYCRISDNTDDVSRYIAGENVNTKVLFEGNPEKLNKIRFKTIGTDKRYDLLVVPVGYQNLTPDFNYQIKNLNKIFNNDKIKFSQLGFSVPVSVEHVGRYSFLSYDSEADYIKEKTKVDKLLFVLNKKEYFGGGGKNIIASGESPYSLFLMTHETGHGFRLNDGYDRYYKKLGTSELFMDLKNLEPLVREAYWKIRPPINDTKNNCNGRKVFTFYKPKSDIMDLTYSDKQLLSKIRNGESIFNPLQMEIIRMDVRQEIGKKVQNRCMTPFPLELPSHP